MYLNCHSNYSLRYGTIPVDSLIEQAKRCNAEYLALTDINCSTGIFDFVKACKENGIQPIAGMEFRQDGKLLYIGLAQNFHGFRELNELITRHNLGESELSKQSPDVSNAYIIYPSSNIPDELKEHEYIGVARADLAIFNNPILKKTNKLVCLQPVTYSNQTEYHLHKLLRCIDHNIILARLSTGQHATAGEIMLPMDQILKEFQSIPQAIRNTNELADSCSFDFDPNVSKNKKTFTGSYYEDKILLESLALEGLKTRYAPNDKGARERLIQELDVIDKLQFACYFLITWDIVRHSMGNGYFHVGRGSGANSIVAYCLHITEVDPIELNLYFARFLNTKRSSPPDFDIDWSWKDRDDIIAYIFKRFGRDYTGFCGTVTDFQYRSTIRELGKVYGLPKEEMDILTRQAQDLHNPSEVISQIHKFGNMLDGFPNQYSMHSCGIFITELPISYYTTMNVYQKGVPTCEIDMYIAESIKLEKVDILSQRGLGHIKDAVELIKTNKGIDIDITKANDFKKDAKCNEMLAKGKTLGCFYIESPAMRGLLRRLKCADYETLVAASSIIRPGVAQSGMMREYVERHRDASKIKYFHKVFEEQLSDTYGVMVYQEDVIKIAHHFAKMEMDEADILRRGMSGKTRSSKEIQLVQEKFFKNCKELGYSDEVTNEVYRQIASFAGYSFCKSHSASYAVESYQSLYLKAYHPLEFITAVINNNGGFYRPEVYINEGRVLGAEIKPPDINTSEQLTNISGTTIHLGLRHVINLATSMKKRIPEERKRNGKYTSLENLITRTGIKQDNLEQLIYVGALSSLDVSKSELIIQSRRHFNHQTKQYFEQSLFQIESKPLKLPELDRNSMEDAFDELEGLGFPVSISPFDLLKTSYRGSIFVKDLIEHENKIVKMLGYLVSIKDVPIKRKDGKLKMNFGTWIDINGGYFDTTHFPPTLKQYPFKGLGCYLLLGKVVIDFDFPSIEIIKMAKMPMIPDPRYSDENDPNYQVWNKMKVAHSKTARAPYPSKGELDELYGRQPASEKSPQEGKSVKGLMSLGGKG
ncbi:MAG: DNA polymerase III subunit alpha [Cyclobacteriaceae bacterium]